MNGGELKQVDTNRYAVTGSMGFETVESLLDESAVLFNGQTAVTLDLGQVRQADIAGLALLLEWLSWARRASQDLEIVNVPDQLLSLARISEVDDLITGQKSDSSNSSNSSSK